MSSPSQDKLNDFVVDHSIELLYAYLEQDHGWAEFVAWFWSKSSDKAREAILEAFIDDYKAKETVAFNEWAVQEASERLQAPNDCDPREDR